MKAVQSIHKHTFCISKSFDRLEAESVRKMVVENGGLVVHEGPNCNFVQIVKSSDFEQVVESMMDGELQHSMVIGLSVLSQCIHQRLPLPELPKIFNFLENVSLTLSGVSEQTAKYLLICAKSCGAELKFFGEGKLPNLQIINYPSCSHNTQYPMSVNLNWIFTCLRSKSLQPLERYCSHPPLLGIYLYDASMQLDTLRLELATALGVVFLNSQNKFQSTHFLVNSRNDLPNTPSEAPGCNVKVVTYEWLDRCVELHQWVNESKFRVRDDNLFHSSGLPIEQPVTDNYMDLRKSLTEQVGENYLNLHSNLIFQKIVNSDDNGNHHCDNNVKNGNNDNYHCDNNVKNNNNGNHRYDNANCIEGTNNNKDMRDKNTSLSSKHASSSNLFKNCFFLGKLIEVKQGLKHFIISRGGLALASDSHELISSLMSKKNGYLIVPHGDFSEQQQHNIPLVSLQWLEACVACNSILPPSRSILFQHWPYLPSHYKPAMHGVTVSTASIADPERQWIKTTICLIGGKFCPDLSLKRTTHLISYSVHGPKQNKALQHGIALVLPKWLEACVRLGKLADVSAYLLLQKPSNTAPATRTLKISVGFSALLGDVVVFVSNRLVAGQREIQQLARSMGAKTTWVFNQNVTHVIHRGPVELVQEVPADVHVHFVLPEWLENCKIQGRRLPESLYHSNASFDKFLNINNSNVIMNENNQIINNNNESNSITNENNYNYENDNICVMNEDYSNNNVTVNENYVIVMNESFNSSQNDNITNENYTANQNNQIINITNENNQATNNNYNNFEDENSIINYYNTVSNQNNNSNQSTIVGNTPADDSSNKLLQIESNVLAFNSHSENTAHNRIISESQDKTLVLIGELLQKLPQSDAHLSTQELVVKSSRSTGIPFFSRSSLLDRDASIENEYCDHASSSQPKILYRNEREECESAPSLVDTQLEIQRIKQLLLNSEPQSVKEQQSDDSSVQKICFSGLNQKPYLLSQLIECAKLLNVAITDCPVQATHLITQSLKKTQKLLITVSLGKWVLKPQWLLESRALGKLIPEESFEWLAEPLSSDLSPRSCRLRVLAQQNRPIFSGWKVLLYTVHSQGWFSILTASCASVSIYERGKTLEHSAFDLVAVDMHTWNTATSEDRTVVSSLGPVISSNYLYEVLRNGSADLAAIKALCNNV